MKQALCIFCVLLSTGVFSQTDSSIKNLVFEGAGIRGIAYCGAVRALEEKDLLKDVERVGGTSAGAITALAIALGYTSGEIAAIISETSFKKFNDGRFIFIGGLNRMNKYFGWYKGQRLEKWVENIIQAKTGDAHITFKQLKEKGFKELYITGTSLTRQQVVVFSHEAYPDMKVKDAVRISVSIPLYFEAIFINGEGQTFTHPKDKTGLEVMADGGFLANFPIRLFDSTKYGGEKQTNRFKINHQTIGFRIDTDQQITNDSSNRQLAVMRIGNFKEYISAFYNIIIENLNRQTLSDEDWQRTISISDGTIAPRIRKLSAKEKDMLINNGRTATRLYIKRSLLGGN
jgi:NTE family protein